MHTHTYRHAYILTSLKEPLGLSHIYVPHTALPTRHRSALEFLCLVSFVYLFHTLGLVSMNLHGALSGFAVLLVATAPLGTACTALMVVMVSPAAPWAKCPHRCLP